MRKFTDKHGQEWAVLITDKVIADLQANADLDLTRLGMPAGEAIEKRMVQDASVVTVALLAACKTQRLGRELTQDDFGKRIEEVYPAARDAVLDALVDWAANASVKARLRRAARMIRAEASRPRQEPPDPTPKKPVEAKAEAKKA